MIRNVRRRRREKQKSFKKIRTKRKTWVEGERQEYVDDSRTGQLAAPTIDVAAVAQEGRRKETFDAWFWPEETYLANHTEEERQDISKRTTEDGELGYRVEIDDGRPKPKGVHRLSTFKNVFAEERSNLDKLKGNAEGVAKADAQMKNVTKQILSGSQEEQKKVPAKKRKNKDEDESGDEDYNATLAAIISKSSGSG